MATAQIIHQIPRHGSLQAQQTGFSCKKQARCKGRLKNSRGFPGIVVINKNIYIYIYNSFIYLRFWLWPGPGYPLTVWIWFGFGIEPLSFDCKSETTTGAPPSTRPPWVCIFVWVPFSVLEETKVVWSMEDSVGIQHTHTHIHVSRYDKGGFVLLVPSETQKAKPQPKDTHPLQQLGVSHILSHQTSRACSAGAGGQCSASPAGPHEGALTEWYFAPRKRTIPGQASHDAAISFFVCLREKKGIVDALFFCGAELPMRSSAKDLGHNVPHCQCCSLHSCAQSREMWLLAVSASALSRMLTKRRLQGSV